jgi:polysaccharide deacetylase
MRRERGARASISRSLAHGLVGWGCLLSIAAGILVTRLHTAEAGRAPLPPVPVTLSSAEYRQWAAFPDYHTMVPVLMYHSIGGRASYLTVSRRLFAEQMLALKVAGFHTLTIRQYAHYVKHGYRGLPSRPILLTFDDGRLDAYRAANDLLQAYGFHATELVVPSWVSGNPRFSLSWSELTRMANTSTWNVQLHFGYGREEVRWNSSGDTGAAFAYEQHFPGQAGQPGHQETFAQYQKRIASNMDWGEQQLKEKVPGYKPWSMAIPESDYGQAGTNDDRIPPWVLGWLGRHFPVVFGGDYLDKAVGRRFQINGRFSPRLAYRMSLGPLDTLAVLHCRLWDFIHHVPIWSEYGCQRRAGISKEVLAALHPPIHPHTAVSDGPPPPPRPRPVRRGGVRIDPRAIRGQRVIIGSRPGWRVVIRATPGTSAAGTTPRHG